MEEKKRQADLDMARWEQEQRQAAHDADEEA
jgi:hypothetical protein